MSPSETTRKQYRVYQRKFDRFLYLSKKFNGRGLGSTHSHRSKAFGEDFTSVVILDFAVWEYCIYLNFNSKIPIPYSISLFL